jgi:flagellar FliL protein
MNKGGKSQTNAADPTSPYVGKRPEYAMYTLIGPVTTRTKDVTDFSVTVDLIIGYDVNDNAAQTELTQRQYELRDFVRSYFTGKYAAELQPENEARLKQEIREILNTRFLDTAKARIILFNKLDVMAVY